ncbi:hypothetical protein D5018_12735 [Parashewanella curva]|uniref:Uncharacterized protein n=1 Tax=Parashewanella curva TaxID=2338552 RepID=A0A3L8PZ34_9GAMM|nr:hypothetical protein [Parashewanella curva]RLV59352.1 hypothetical protein D5018_12735 [Parashewanella curva]
MNAINKLASMACLGLTMVMNNAFSEDISVHLECSADVSAPAILTIPRVLGFFSIRPAITPNNITSLWVFGPLVPGFNTILFSGLKESINYSVELNKLATDQQSGKQVRRLKLKFGSPKQDNNFSNSESDTVKIKGYNHFCVNNPNVQKDLKGEVKLGTKYITPHYGLISLPGVVTTDDAIPVDFKGGNGSPLSIYIEGGITETGINYSKAIPKDNPFDNIDLTLIPSNNESLLPDASYRKGEITFLPYYSQHNPIGSYSDAASYEIDSHSINLSVARIDKDTVVDTDFNSLPSIQQTLAGYDAPPPAPGWYVPDVTLQKMNAENQPDIFESVKSFSQVPVVISSNDSKESIQMAELIEQGSVFQNQLLNPNVFDNGRFYIVDSVDSEGRVRLKKLQPNDDTTPIYFDFSKLSDGNITKFGNLIRWLIKDEKGNDKIQEGYFAWHAPDGSYAFLNLYSGGKSLSTLPKKDDVIAFEFAKVE